MKIGTNYMQFQSEKPHRENSIMSCITGVTVTGLTGRDRGFVQM